MQLCSRQDDSATKGAVQGAAAAHLPFTFTNRREQDATLHELGEGQDLPLRGQVPLLS
jgi:hypothetical protein